ncbi:STAS domain-containing protein [Actinomadura verrucosospora]|uniref:Anti-sigma factor antagonist n=1 Tax=Actinomadura verrucosospora TaxID=46165 RepID=A0A7D4AQN5_ACTVE|nr:STAS domain-containing protein [Actinomadura verrucosospora]QKG24308.1 anti-sigma-factor antagonist domain-containing protein [Actinomadura verrucosospora]
MTPQHRPSRAAADARTASSEAVLSREQHAGHTLIALGGELDIASAPSLRERLRVALIDAGPHVVIDLSGVTFCDVSGLALLIGARRRIGPGGTLVLAGPRPQMVRLLHVTGLDRAFAVRPAGGALPAADRSRSVAA